MFLVTLQYVDGIVYGLEVETSADGSANDRSWTSFKGFVKIQNESSNSTLV